MEGIARKARKQLLHFSIILLFVSLPFLTICHLFGTDTFVDSFDYPQFYVYVKNSKITIEGETQGYLVIQKISHPQFTLSTGDSVLFIQDDGAIECEQIHSIGRITGLQRYYVMDHDENIREEPVYNYQIIGKIIGRLDDTIWNALSLKVWDMSINNLNAAALLSQ